MGEASFKIMLIIFNVIFIAFIGAIIMFVREYRIKKREHIKELETVDILHKKELLKTQTEIQKETMNYIGREIHDNVGQKLTLSSIYLQQLIYENKAPLATENITSINDIINESLRELRHLSKYLTDDTIENNSIVELIEEECKKIRALKKYHIEFKISHTINIESYQIKSVLLRVIQEFLQNSIKHSDCKNIKILISDSKKELEVLLKDDGKGFDVQTLKTNGIGLKNIKKRIEMIQGSLSFESNQHGTTLTLKIPI